MERLDKVLSSQGICSRKEVKSFLKNKRIKINGVFPQKSDIKIDPECDIIEVDGRILEVIAKQNPHKIIFVLVHEGRRKVAIYHNKLYNTSWKNENEISLTLNGGSLDEIWSSFVEQTALYEEQAENVGSLSIDERLALQEQITKLEKLIAKTEKSAWKEQQPKKKFELYSKLKQYQKELEILKNG